MERTMYNMYMYCKWVYVRGSLCKILMVTEPWSLQSLQSLYQVSRLECNVCELAVTGVGRLLFSVLFLSGTVGYQNRSYCEVCGCVDIIALHQSKDGIDFSEGL